MGVGIFHQRRCQQPGVVIETLTGNRLAMFQRYLPAIKEGDKRILIVDGEVMPYCLARLPQVPEPEEIWLRAV